MIKVFQIQLSDEDVIKLNAEGWGCSDPKIVAYRNKSLMRPEDVDMQLYMHVADVYCEDIEQAFVLMNLWNDHSKVKVVAGSCSSMSVGDVVEHNGKLYLCACVGFEEIGQWRGG